MVELSGGHVDGERCLAPRGNPLLKLAVLDCRQALRHITGETDDQMLGPRMLTYHRTNTVTKNERGELARVYRLERTP